MKISEVKVHGIKSYEDVTLKMEDYTVFVGEGGIGVRSSFHPLEIIKILI